MVNIANILRNEVLRVNNRKTAIDNAEEERKRIIALTSSATERQRAYNTIYAVIVAMLLGVVIIKMLYRFEFVPDFVLDILIAAVVSAGLIYSLLLYSDIMRRNNMDFGQIDFGDAPAKSQAQLDQELKDKIASGNLGGIASELERIASENDGKCNSADTIYNKKYGVCYPKTVPANKVPVEKSGNILSLGGKDTAAIAIISEVTAPEATTAGDGRSAQAQIAIDDAKTYLKNSTKYQYCRRKDGTYDWLPVGAENIQLDTVNSVFQIRRVVPADPNYYLSPNRLTHVAETLSTWAIDKRPVDSFTTLEHSDGASVAPFSSNNLYAKYI
jgi:hypothetical protein